MEAWNHLSPELQEFIHFDDMENKYSTKAFIRLRDEGWKFKNKINDGYKLPWRSLQDKMFMVKGELTVLSGYTGQGKSEVAINLGLYAIEQGAKLFVASSEMQTGALWERIATNATGIKDHTEEYYNAIADYYARKIFIYDKLGMMEISNLLDAMQYVRDFLRIDFFIIDNLMMLDKKTDDYNKQLEHIQLLSAFAKENNVIVLLVAHSRKPQTSSHTGALERVFSPPGIHEIHGASSIGNMIDNHLSVTINHTKKRALAKLKAGVLAIDLSDREQKSLNEGDSILIRDKKREFGDYFYHSLHYDERFRRLKDFESERLKPFVPFEGLV